MAIYVPVASYLNSVDCLEFVSHFLVFPARTDS